MKRANGSAIKYVLAVSPVGAGLGAAGSSDPVDFSQMSWGTLLATMGSGNNFTASVERSATSNGTFAQFGASVTLTTGSGQVAARSFTMDSSAVWYRVAYSNNGAGSVNPAVYLIGADVADVPITQHTNTTVYSDVV